MRQFQGVAEIQFTGPEAAQAGSLRYIAAPQEWRILDLIAVTGVTYPHLYSFTPFTRS